MISRIVGREIDMERWRMRAVDLITSLAFGGREQVGVVPFYPQKTSINGAEKKYFKRTVPEKKGISSKRLYNMLCELEGEAQANIHSLMVIRGGEVICECSADGYNVNCWHISHSMSKTVLGMVIGRLIDDGLLSIDQRLADIFPEIPYRDKRFKEITVEHLLAMTSGVDFAEPGVVTEKDWTAAFFASPIRFAPGAKFAYNSMNSYILARVAERICDRSFGDMAREFIFLPLGIENYFWEKGPEGTEKGGWGLYMSVESWAKVGYMLLSDGVFEGKRVLSSEWVRKSSTVKAISPEVNGGFNYAYQMWVGRDNDEILFNGMLGQNVWICPKNDIIVVITSGNNELFQASPSLEIIRKHLGAEMYDRISPRDTRLLLEKQAVFFDSRRWVRPKEEGRGLLYWLGLKTRNRLDRAWEQIYGSYAVVKNNVGLLPLFVRALQNNLNTVIEKIDISALNEELVLGVSESGESYKILVGTYGYAENVIDYQGEKYLIYAVGEVTYDRCGGREYRIELLLPETASVRRIRIKKIDEGRLLIDFSESPNHRLAENLLERYSQTSSVVSFVAEMLERRLGEGESARIIKRSFNPTLVGVDVNLPDYEEVITKENSELAKESGTVKLLRTIVDRFFKEKK